MLARLLRLFLLFEAFAYLAGAVALVKFSAWKPGGAILVMMFVALAWRSAAVFATYLVALNEHGRVRQQAGFGVTRELREGLRELGARLALSVAQSFERVFPRRDVPSKPAVGRLPLLLVHGYCCNRGFWWWLKPRLETRGCSVATITLEPLFGNIDGYAQQVARRVDVVCRETGAERLVLAGHSMGGLVIRAYLRRYGEARVARLVTLGTPHRGSALARIGPGRNSRQMEPGSSWLRELELAPLLVPCIACHSSGDNFVMPSSAALAGAESRALPAVGHIAMSISPVVLETLLAATAA